MSERPTTAGAPDVLLPRLGDWLRRSRSLATQVGRPDNLDAATRLYARIDRPGAGVVVTGGPNAGKSRLLNRYLGVDLLPVTAISEGHEVVIEGAGLGEEETVALTGEPPRPLGLAPAVFESAPRGGPAIRFRLARTRLARRKLILAETLLDAPEAEVPALAARLPHLGDVVVLVLDANAALRRADQALLRECERRGLPVVVAVAKADLIPDDERESLLGYLRHHVGDPARTPLALAPDPDGTIGTLAAAIDGALAELEPTPVRTRQAAIALAEALDGLLAAALAARELQARRDADRAEAVSDRRVALEGNDLIWQEVQLGLLRRRQGAETRLRDHLAANRQSILEVLLYELERAPEVKAWWERDLPFRLQRDLRALAAQLSGAFNRQIAADLQWLREELQRRLGHSIALVVEPTTIEGPAPDLADPSLVDSNTLKITSRVGSGAAAIAAATLFATSGVGGIALAASIAAGLLGEQYIRIRTNQDREVVRSRLGPVVAQAELDSAGEVARKLGEAYDRVLGELRAQQLRWQQDQLRALRDFADAGSDPAAVPAAAAVDPLRTLAAEIRDALRLPTSTELQPTHSHEG